jgi:hypothetical protein
MAGTNASDVAVADGLKGSIILTANTVGYRAVSGLDYRVQYKMCVEGHDTSMNPTSPEVTTVTFQTRPKAPGTPGRYSMRRITRDRQRLGNQILNTMRG